MSKLFAYISRNAHICKVKRTESIFQIVQKLRKYGKYSEKRVRHKDFPADMFYSIQVRMAGDPKWLRS